MSSKEERKEFFIRKLERLIHISAANRRERFIPFLIVLAGKRDHLRYGQSLNIAHYFVQNAMLFTKGDEDFHRTLKLALSREKQTQPIEWDQCLQDYLKVVYDLR